MTDKSRYAMGWYEADIASAPIVTHNGDPGDFLHDGDLTVDRLGSRSADERLEQRDKRGSTSLRTG